LAILATEVAGLMEDAFGARDRAGDDIREEGHKGRVIKEAAGRKEALVAVDEIHDLGDSEEADAKRKFKIWQQKARGDKVRKAP
jgi:hypothetical protein